MKKNFVDNRLGALPRAVVFPILSSRLPLVLALYALLMSALVLIATPSMPLVSTPAIGSLIAKTS